MFLAVFVALSLNTSAPSFAHLPGQPPFFRVNEIFSPYYRVPTTSLNDFPLPQDMGPTEYTVGTPLSLEIDPSQLQVPDDIIKKTTFAWDYGDGTKGTGLKNTHTYKKVGSYTLSITASYTDQGEYVPPQLFQSVQLDIIPNKSYKMPRAVVSVNGTTVKNPLNDSVKVKPGSEVTLDASKSLLNSTPVSYFWDFGDGETGTGERVTHTYDSKTKQAFPVLRIKDKDGFVIDNLSQIKFTKDAKAAKITNSSTDGGNDKQISNFYVWGIGGTVALIAVLLFLLWLKKKKLFPGN